MRLLWVLLTPLLWLAPAVAIAGSVNASSVIDVTPGAGDDLAVGGAKLNAHYHVRDAATLTNKTGGSLVAGDVVALATGNDAAVALADTASSRRQFVVAEASIATDALGEFTRNGVTTAKAQGSIARGDYVRKSATSKALESTTVATGADTTIPDGTIGLALSAASGGVVTVYLFGRTATVDALIAGANVTLTPGVRQTTISSSAGGGLVDINYLFNANFEIFGAGTGTSNPPTGWTISTGQVASPSKDTTNFKYGAAAVAVQRAAGTNAKVIQNAAATYAPAASWRGQAVVFACWVRATVATRARLGIDDGVGSTQSSYHTGGSAFEWLTVSRTLDASATKVEVQLLVDTGNTTAQFDGCVLTKGSVAPGDYFPEAWRGRKSTMQFGSAAATNANPSYYGIGTNTTEAKAFLPVPFVRGVVRNLVVKTSGTVTSTETLRYNAADSSLTCSLSSSDNCTDTTHELEVGQTGLLAIKTTDGLGTIFHNATVEIEEIP